MYIHDLVKSYGSYIYSQKSTMGNNIYGQILFRFGYKYGQILYSYWIGIVINMSFLCLSYLRIYDGIMIGAN